jgi:P pilus assembly chaperone PapD
MRLRSNGGPAASALRRCVGPDVTLMAERRCVKIVWSPTTLKEADTEAQKRLRLKEPIIKRTTQGLR